MAGAGVLKSDIKGVLAIRLLSGDFPAAVPEGIAADVLTGWVTGRT
jgi:hypothetical protein